MDAISVDFLCVCENTLFCVFSTFSNKSSRTEQEYTKVNGAFI